MLSVRQLPALEKLVDGPVATHGEGIAAVKPEICVAIVTELHRLDTASLFGHGINIERWRRRTFNNHSIGKVNDFKVRIGIIKFKLEETCRL
jgi:hypothetical protein